MEVGGNGSEFLRIGTSSVPAQWFVPTILSGFLKKNVNTQIIWQVAENTAIICSLLGSCKERGVNPREWLNDVIGKPPYYLVPKSDRDPRELLPDVWRK